VTAIFPSDRALAIVTNVGGTRWTQMAPSVELSRQQAQGRHPIRLQTKITKDDAVCCRRGERCT
jgi:hypothetical protein